MLSFTSSQQYYLSIGCVDMRKGCDGLSGVVRQGLGRNPLSGEVYIFLNRRRTHLKLLVWDRSGFVVYCKRLERGTFELPKQSGQGGSLPMRWDELVMLLEGIKLKSVRFRKRFSLEEKTN